MSKRDNGDRVMDKLLGRKAIEKLKINLMDKTDEDFRKARLKHVKDWIEAGKTKAWAEADFDQKYADADSWKAQNSSTLSSFGQQRVLDKIDEIIDYVNEL